MSELTHQRCPFPDCGSSDAFAFNTTKGKGYCHSCSNPYPISSKGGVKVVYAIEFADLYPILNAKGINFSDDAGVISGGAVKQDSKPAVKAEPKPVQFDLTEPLAPVASGPLLETPLPEVEQTSVPTEGADVEALTSNLLTPKSKGPFVKFPVLPRPGEFTPLRGITRETLRFFGCADAFDANGVRVGHTYWYNKNVKFRIFPKDFRYGTGDTDAPAFKADHFYARDLFPAGCSRVLTICEGEIDAMSGFQMTAKDGYLNPFTSLPSATPKIQAFLSGANLEWLKSFEKIVMSIDADDKAMKFAQTLCRLLPGKVFKMRMDPSLKDANGYLMAGHQRAFVSAWYGAELMRPEATVSTAEEFRALAYKEPVVMRRTGISFIDDELGGLAQRGLTTIHGAEGIGKSELARLIYSNLFRNTDARVAICHLEEDGVRTGDGFASYLLNEKCVTSAIPGQIRPAALTERVADTLEGLAERVVFFELGLDSTEEELEGRLRYYAIGCGCNYIVIDPIQDLAYYRADQKESTEQYLSRVVTRLAALSQELNTGIVLLAHENDHGQIRDCRMVSKRSAVVLRCERNVEADDIHERMALHITCKKNRWTSTTGRLGSLHFDPLSYTLRENFGDLPRGAADDETF